METLDAVFKALNIIILFVHFAHKLSSRMQA